MYIYTIKTGNKTQKIISLLPPEKVFDRELPSEGIVGILTKYDSQINNIDSKNFIANPKFINFLNQVIVKFAPHNPDLVTQAKRQNNGWLYLIDARCSNPTGSVLSEDIIGVFELKEGEIIAKSYQRNNNHLIVSQNGFFKLEPRLQKHLIEETRKLIGK